MQPDFNTILIINLITGAVFGLAPLILGLKRRKIALAIIGFLSSIAVGPIAGFLLVLPIAGLFTWLILRGTKPPASSGE